MWTLMITAALAASPYKEANADVVVSTSIPASPEAIYPALTDLQHIERLMEPCAEDFVAGPSTTGDDANARVTYHVLAFKRRVTVKFDEVRDNRLVQLDHLGNKGFLTRWLLTDNRDGSTTVELASYLNAPPWPFRKYYFEEIQPNWRQCYEGALDKLAAEVAE